MSGTLQNMYIAQKNRRPTERISKLMISVKYYVFFFMISGKPLCNESYLFCVFLCALMDWSAHAHTSQRASVHGLMGSQTRASQRASVHRLIGS